jgi:hypothetical protein
MPPQRSWSVNMKRFIFVWISYIKNTKKQEKRKKNKSLLKYKNYPIFYVFIYPENNWIKILFPFRHILLKPYFILLAHKGQEHRTGRGGRVRNQCLVNFLEFYNNII